ncbi:MAG TPA: hypothetical protein DIT25_01040 [Candidatus Moranbacteria bacterium]|nr:hypothetical protein [Candidatus Moranbacteria bacterium]
MNLLDHIENIRQKPEHIRMRYVWAFVAISMAFVFIIWFFSIKTEQKEKAPIISEEVFNSEAVTGFKDQKENLKSAVEGVRSVIKEQK